MKHLSSGASTSLERIEPFCRFTPQLRGHFERAAVAKRAEGKEIIFHEGDPSLAGFVVLSGRVAMLKSSPNGKELIIELIFPGFLFGLVALLDDRPYPLTARAQVPSEILALPRAPLGSLVAEHPEIRAAFARIVSDRFRSAQNLARMLAHESVEARVASILLALAPHAARPGGDGLELEIGRQELADLAGITLETASRVAKRLERQGMIDASGVGSVRLLDCAALASLREP